MKNKKLCLGILVMVFGITVVGCATVSTNNNGSDIPVGFWTSYIKISKDISMTSTYIINADGSYSVTINTYTNAEKGSWVISGNVVTFTRSDNGATYTGTIFFNRMTMEGLTFTKQ